MTKLQISNRTIELLVTNPDYGALPTQQAEAYQLLMTLGDGNHTEQAIVAQLGLKSPFGLKSPLPWRSRLEHLQERGWIRILAVVA
jgi:hypothetical protein